MPTFDFFKRLGLLGLMGGLAIGVTGCDSDGGGDGPDPDPDPTATLMERDDNNRFRITDRGEGVGTMTWTADEEYVLNGFVFVNDGQTLTIEPGTVVRGASNVTGAGNAGALIVARGGRIIAEGTAADPIIFTAESAAIDSDNGGARGLWGGLIVLGRARTNATGGDPQIEGVPDDNARGAYGGTDDADNSGIIRYVSIRHGGSDIGQGNEINGLTMGGVGSGTTIDHVEVIYNQDDGFEWFGGTVDTKYLVSAFNGDDAFDIDQGFRGRGQFWVDIHADGDQGDHSGEHDGGSDPDDARPFATPIILNATYIGSDANDLSFLFADNFAGKYYNSIFGEMAGTFIEIEDTEDTDTGDSRARFESTVEAERIAIEGNILYGYGDYDADGANGGFDSLVQLTLNDDDEIVDPTFSADVGSYLQENNTYGNPMLANIIRSASASLDLRPAAGGLAFDRKLAVSEPSGFFDDVDYIGAFGSENWAAGWSFAFTGE